MKKHLLAVHLLGFFFLVLGISSVQAVYIEADNQQIRIYDDSVLGEHDTLDDNDKKEFLRERYSPRRTIDAELIEIRVKPTSSTESKVEILKGGTYGYALSSGEETRLELLVKTDPKLLEAEREKEKKLEEEKIRLQQTGISAGEAEKTLQQKEQQLEQELETKVQQIEQEKKQQEAASKQLNPQDALIKAIQQKQQEARAAQEQPAAEATTARTVQTDAARERVKTILVKDVVKGNSREVKLESNGTPASIKNGIEVVIKPDTGAVKVVTPIGEEKTLQNFPDEAAIKMQQAKLLQYYQFNSANIKNMELNVTPTGSVNYQAKIEATRKILGIIPQQVELNVGLNDRTGQVETVQPQINQNLLQAIMSAVQKR